MSEPMKCAECGEVFDADDLVYNDDIGSDVCEDCDANATPDAVEVEE